MRRFALTFLKSAAILGGFQALITARRRRQADRFAQQQLAALTHAVRALACTASTDEFLVHVLRAIAEQLRAGWVMLFLHDPGADTLVVHLMLKDGILVPREQAPTNLSRPLPAAEVPIWGDLLRNRRPIYVPEVAREPRLREREALIAQGVRSLLIVPLFIGETLIGWFSVRSTIGRAYRPDQLALAGALAQQAAIAVHLSRLDAQGRRVAVWEERSRMAREIHDTLAQGFTGVLMQLEATESALETGQLVRARERLGRARELARTGLQEARRSVWALRPEHLEAQSFSAALCSVVTALTAGTSLQVHVALDEYDGPLPPELEIDLLRVVQEAVTNTVRHAAARTLSVGVTLSAAELEVRIVDDGRGFVVGAARPYAGGGLGLTAMRERLERHHGRLIVESSPGHGATLIALVPLPDRA